MMEWVRRLFEAIDRMDADGFVEFLSEGARFRFGSQPAVVGKESIRKVVGEFFSSIGGLQHRILNIWEVPGNVVCEGEVTYTRKDRSRVTVPFVDVFRMQGSLIGEYLIYIDISPLFSAG